MTTKGLQINEVEFARRGRGQAGKTYIAGVFGTPQFSDDGEFTGLMYDFKGIREEEVRQILETKGYDAIECMVTGHDVISKREASASSSQKSVFLNWLMNDGYCPNLSGKEKVQRLNSFAMGMIYNMNSQDDANPRVIYGEFVSKLKKEFQPISS